MCLGNYTCKCSNSIYMGGTRSLMPPLKTIWDDFGITITHAVLRPVYSATGTFYVWVVLDEQEEA